MQTMINLIIYIAIICLGVFLLNKLFTKKNSEPEKEHFNNTNFNNTNETIDFDYGNSNINTPDEHIQTIETINDKYKKELINGVTFKPDYNSNYTLDEYEDQKVIYNNAIYTHPIHTTRSIDTNTNKPIREIFDSSITDFKKLSPNENGIDGDTVVSGGFNSGNFNPDFRTYDNEKPENGGIFTDNNLYAYDPLIQTDNAIF